MLQDYKEKPDYGRCVSIVASASLREMIKPGALAIVSPIVVGKLLTHLLLVFAFAIIENVKFIFCSSSFLDSYLAS